MNKKWPNDPRIDCKPPSNLVELIKKDLKFEEELENFKVLWSGMNLWTLKNVSKIYLILMFIKKKLII